MMTPNKQLFQFLFALTIWHSANVLAQNVTTLTPTPFDASGGLSVATDGTIFLANWGANTSDATGDEVYRITPEGNVSVFVNGLAGAAGNAFDSEGNLFQVGWLTPEIYKITPDGTISIFAASSDGLVGPVGVTIDSSDNLYVANCQGQRILKFTPGGEASEFTTGSGLFSCPVGVETDDQDNLYVSNFHNPTIVKVTPAGDASVLADTTPWSGTDSHNQMMVFAHGRLYLASERANQILEVSLEGEVSVLAGTGEAGNVDGPLLEATLSRPWGIDISPDGRKLYVTSSDPPPAHPTNWTPNVVRVIELPNVAEPFQINAGMNDAWVGADAPFQGLFFTVFPDIGFFFLSWFTFDSVIPIGDDTAVFGADDQRWVTGGGFYSGNSVTINVELTSGGIFNGSDPKATQAPGYGTITITFINCNEALLTYDFPSVGLSGEMTLNRVLPDNVALCQALNDS